MSDEVQAAGSAAKKIREVEKVEMQDGRKVEFVGKQKLLKEAGILEGGTFIPIEEATPEQIAGPHQLAVRMDFRNGATRTYPLNSSILHRYALHGALQKYGDQLAGGVKNEDGSESQDLDDWALETDALHEQLSKGEWAKARVGGGGGGISVLLQALMEFTGKSQEEVREHIKNWTQADKIQIRNSDEIRPIVERIEKEKAAKAGHVDVAGKISALKALAGG